MEVIKIDYTALAQIRVYLQRGDTSILDNQERVEGEDAGVTQPLTSQSGR